MLKTVSKDVVKFITSGELEELKKDPTYKATAIYFKRLSKREYDHYTGTLAEIRRGKFHSKIDEATKLLFEKCLCQNSEGVIVENAMVEGKFVEKITDKSQAVEFLLELGDIESAGEIELAMKGQSVLSEEEEKNSDGR